MGDIGRGAMKPARQTFSIAAGLLLAPGFLGLVCNEHLPPYWDPRGVFQGSIEGTYVLTLSDNSVKIYLHARNQYDETLEGVATLEGEVEIYLARNPTKRKTFVLTSANLFTSSNYNPQTRNLRVEPGETLVFGVSWDLVDETGVDLRSQTFQYWEDPECTFRCIAEEERFVIRGSVQIFEKTGVAEASPTSFLLCHVNQYIEPRFCPPIDASVPCSKRAVTTGPTARPCSSP